MGWHQVITVGLSNPSHLACQGRYICTQVSHCRGIDDTFKRSFVTHTLSLSLSFFFFSLTSYFAAGLPSHPLAMFSNLSTHAFVRRHIQNAADAKYEIEYWGYAVRMLPCTNDAGSCEYLDAVYGMHEYSMVYTFIMWAIVGGLLLIIMSARILRPKRKNGKGARQGFMYRLTRTSSALYRRFLLPESFPNVFPYTTRLQVLILAILCGYLIVFS